MRPWTQAEIEKLEKYKQEELYKIRRRLPHRSQKAISCKMYDLGIWGKERKRPKKRKIQWTKAEDNIIINTLEYPLTYVQKKLTITTRTGEAIKHRRFVLKQRKRNPTIFNNPRGYSWEAWEDDLLQLLVGDKPVKDIVKILPYRTPMAIRQRAAKLSLYYCRWPGMPGGRHAYDMSPEEWAQPPQGVRGHTL